MLCDGLLGVLVQQELHQHAGFPGQRIFVTALSGWGCLGGTCPFLLWALGTFIRSCAGNPCIRRARGHGSLKLLAIASSREAPGRTLREGKRGTPILGLQHTVLGLLGTLSVPLYLVAFPVGMILIVVPPRHGDTGQGPQARMLAGEQVRRAHAGWIKRYCEHLHQGESSLA